MGWLGWFGWLHKCVRLCWLDWVDQVSWACYTNTTLNRLLYQIKPVLSFPKFPITVNSICCQCRKCQENLNISFVVRKSLIKRLNISGLVRAKSGQHAITCSLLHYNIKVCSRNTNLLGYKFQLVYALQAQDYITVKANFR